MPGTVDQDHAVMFAKPRERPPHRFENGTGAMQHHDRRTAHRVAEFDDVKAGAATSTWHPAQDGPLHQQHAACVTSARTTGAATTITAPMENPE